MSAEYVAAWLNGITEFEEEDGRIPAGSCQKYFKVEYALEIATNVVNKIGYFSSGSECSTKGIVCEALQANRHWLDRINYNLSKKGLETFTETELYSSISKEMLQKKTEKLNGCVNRQ